MRLTHLSNLRRKIIDILMIDEILGNHLDCLLRILLIKKFWPWLLDISIDEPLAEPEPPPKDWIRIVLRKNQIEGLHFTSPKGTRHRRNNVPPFRSCKKNGAASSLQAFRLRPNMNSPRSDKRNLAYPHSDIARAQRNDIEKDFPFQIPLPMKNPRISQGPTISQLVKT